VTSDISQNNIPHDHLPKMDISNVSDKSNSTASTSDQSMNQSNEIFNWRRLVQVKCLKTAIYGKVMLCEDTYTRRKVAVKISNISDRKLAENPRQEESILAALRSEYHGKCHPHICELLGSFIDEENNFCVVLEFCNGGEMLDLILNNKAANNNSYTLKTQTMKDHFKKLVGAMQFLHSMKIAHLDCSLENLLLNNGVIKLCDFGLAQRCTPGVLVPCAQSFGKRQYMPPEIYYRQDYDAFQCDSWSLGIILFIMLTGIPPFEAPAKTDPKFKLIYRGELKTLVNLWKIQSLVNDDACDLISKLLCPPGQRLSMTEILAHKLFDDNL
jgi:serine/threonine protein kinase